MCILALLGAMALSALAEVRARDASSFIVSLRVDPSCGVSELGHGTQAGQVLPQVSCSPATVPFQVHVAADSTLNGSPAGEPSLWYLPSAGTYQPDAPSVAAPLSSAGESGAVTMVYVVF
ncbi:hypothetical protein [Candidimonas nitroreducens]|nr:hypothetical protein [Candidimonas nitroreducens]